MSEKTLLKHPDTFKAFVEDFTGGPGGCQVAKGGTCIRPDIITNLKVCDTCPYVEFCLCRTRVLSKKK